MGPSQTTGLVPENGGTPGIIYPEDTLPPVQKLLCRG
jgi:hypothetical protein